MCGIVGYIGCQQASPILMEGLSRLSYRGYDSAGVAILDAKQKLNIRKAKGRLENLETLLMEQPLTGSVGIGHTRWATHEGCEVRAVFGRDFVLLTIDEAKAGVIGGMAK